MSRGEGGCGGHGFTEAGEPVFDYSCDDCVLPANHYDPPELNARTCEADCPNPIRRWHNGRGLCPPHYLASRQYLSGRPA